MKAIRCHGPTADWKRWGLFVTASFLWLVVAGCADTAPRSCADQVDMSYAAAEDSLGLIDFLALDAAQQQARRQLARRFEAEASSAGRADYCLRALTSAAGLAPDDPGIWLRLARVWRWLGDYLLADTSLDNAVAAVNALNTGSPVIVARGVAYKETAALETAMQRAWLHYDRGEWRKAMSWVRAVLRVEPGNEAALQIRGLLEAIQGRRGMAHEIASDLERKDEFTSDTAWILSNLDIARGRWRSAFNYFLDLRPDPRHAAECYRDMGRAAERVKEWSYVRKWYRESAAALPFRNITCLREVEHTPIGNVSGKHKLPFWLAFDQYYVTGSLSAYLAYAFERFEVAETAADRELWGGFVVNAAGICLRLEMEKPHVRRARGLVFARTGRHDRALADLRTAVREFGAKSKKTPQLEAEIGHLLLLQEDHQGAIGHLRRALAGEPNSAQALSDLGLALIMAGDRAGAEEALTRAISLAPTLTAAWYNRGLMHLHMGHLDQAETDLAEAARLAPDNMEVANLLQQVMQQKRAR